jgi:hypothetical protein
MSNKINPMELYRASQRKLQQVIMDKRDTLAMLEAKYEHDEEAPEVTELKQDILILMLEQAAESLRAAEYMGRTHGEEEKE